MKILIVKTSSLGDIVLAFPAIGYIKEKFPEATIDWVVEESFSSLVTAHPAIDQTLTVDTKSWRKGLFSSSVRRDIWHSVQKIRQNRYDVIFDLQGNMKSGVITALAKGQVKVGFSWESVSEWPNMLFTNKRYSFPENLDVRSTNLHLVQSYFNDLQPLTASSVALKLTEIERASLKSLLADLKAKNKPLVMVCHGSNWKNKQVTPQALSEFLKLLQPHLNCNYLFAWGGEAEKAQATSFANEFENSSVLPKVSLPMLQHLMSEMQLVVSMDSLPLHLAATTTTATFSVFGPSSAERYAPLGEKHCFLQGSCPYGRSFSNRCPILRSCPTGACIRDLSGIELFERYMSS